MTYPISTEALDDRLAWVGATGSGKTYNAGSGVERLMASGARVVIIDPLDVWWGLRLREDGKTASVFSPVIFGGPQGDLPLNERAGGLLGETVASMRESCIISLADFRSSASERRFMLDFLAGLDRNANKEPVHLIFDEADLWAPQLVLDKEGDANKLLGQMQTIVRRGRVKGFIPWLITQRPAEISKGVLSQIDGMVAFKLTSSQDRDAIGGWIKGQADAEVGKAILASLPTMQQGQGVVWVPGRAILDTAQFPAKTTFDSSRTPKRGDKKRSATLKPLDLGKLKDRLAAVEAEAKANDPEALKAEIARLTREIAQNRNVAPAPPAGPTAKDVKDAEERGYGNGLAVGKRVVLKNTAQKLHASMEAWVNGLLAEAETITPTPVLTAAAAAETPKPPSSAQSKRPSASSPRAATAADAPVADGSLTGPQVHLLRALAWWLAIGHSTPSRVQVATIAEWKPSGSNLRNRLSELSTRGMVDYPTSGAVRLTPAGVAAAPEPDASRNLLDSIRAVLTAPQLTVFEALLSSGEMTRAALAEQIGWQPAGSNIRNRLSELSSLELVEYPTAGVAQLRAWVTE